MMERFINSGLLSVGNILAIGAILIFWSLVGYAISTAASGNTSS